MSEPGWPRTPNDLLSKTLRVIEQPATGRVLFLGNQRSEVLQEGVPIVPRAGVGTGVFVYAMSGLVPPAVGEVDEVQVCKTKSGRRPVLDHQVLGWFLKWRGPLSIACTGGQIANPMQKDVFFSIQISCEDWCE